MKTISIIGSTGSIGTQSLEVARERGYKVCALAAGKNTALLERQAREFAPRLVSVAGEEEYRDMRARLADTDITVEMGDEGLCRAACAEEADQIVNAVMGIRGLRPTLAALQAGKQVALANKETLVSGGALVTGLAREKGLPIIPIDSEHSAIFQCLQGNEGNAPRRILLTASGGPFFGKKREELAGITPEQALRHPNWAMGPKITVDSATLMNKGLELIEAIWLFGVAEEQVEILVHRQSVIHSAVEFADGAVMAQLGVPDMKVPIQYALTSPARLPLKGERLDLFAYGSLTFQRPDEETFVPLAACRRAIRQGGLKPCAANGADEQAVELFLQGKLPFLQIGDLVWEAMEAQPAGEADSLETILEADRAAREYVLAHAHTLR